MELCNSSKAVVTFSSRVLSSSRNFPAFSMLSRAVESRKLNVFLLRYSKGGSFAGAIATKKSLKISATLSLAEGFFSFS